MATRWGIVGAGKISHDFVTALALLPKSEHEVVSVAARDPDRASAFAAKHRIRSAVASYEDLAKDSNVQVAYIGVTAPHHFRLCVLMLEAGKHVLCEKPLCLNAEDVREIVRLAAEKKLFFMEAVWSRAFPMYKKLRALIKDNSIGEPTTLLETFGQSNNHLPGERLASKENGGGTIFDWGVYCIQMALLVFQGERPEKVVASTVGINDLGVDLGLTVTLHFSRGRSATFVTDLRVQLPCEANIAGTDGNIKIGSPFWCPTEMTVSRPSEGHIERFEYPVPSGAEFPFFFTNSSGLNFEAQEVRRCLEAGVTESEVMTHKESVLIAEITEEIAKQIGL